MLENSIECWRTAEKDVEQQRMLRVTTNNRKKAPQGPR